MKTILTITDRDLGFNVLPAESYQERRASRAVVFDDQGSVALLYVGKKRHHKLPGGGLEEGEDFLTALQREIREEIGCVITDVRELGLIEEVRDRNGLRQISACFTARVVGEKHPPQFEQDEIDDGFEPVWMPLDEAVKTLENESETKHYEGSFMSRRDMAILKAAQKN